MGINVVSTPVIEVKNLIKTYGPIKAVDDISFSIRQSEIFGMLGPNGAGKTTTVEILEGLVILAAVLAATLIAGLIYWALLGIGWAVVYGAIRGAINEVKNFLKELRG